MIELNIKKLKYEDFPNLPKEIRGDIEYVDKDKDNDFYKEYQIEKMIRKMNANLTLNHLCDILNKDFKIDKVLFSYSGCGDNGEVEDLEVLYREPLDKEYDKFKSKWYGVELVDNQVLYLYKVWDRDKKKTISLPHLDTDTNIIRKRWCDGEHKEVNITLYDSLVDALYEMLPGGWEINEGSSGNIELDTKTKYLSHNHLEYVQEEIDHDFSFNIKETSDLLLKNGSN
jgi:hypothetical protein